MIKLFTLHLVIIVNTANLSASLQRPDVIHKAGPSALVGSFFIFFAGAFPQFLMSVYQAYHNNSIHMDSSSEFVRRLYPFILRVDERSFTINPTTIRAKEYFLTGLGLSGLSILFALIEWGLSKLPEPSTRIDNVSIGQGALQVFPQVTPTMFFTKISLD